MPECSQGASLAEGEAFPVTVVAEMGKAGCNLNQGGPSANCGLSLAWEALVPISLIIEIRLYWSTIVRA